MPDFTLKNGAMPMPECIMGYIMVDLLNRYIFIPEDKAEKKAMGMELKHFFNVSFLSVKLVIKMNKYKPPK